MICSSRGSRYRRNRPDLDIDALRIVASGVNQLKTKGNATIVITHYQRLLDYIRPDFVHVLYHGRIVHTAADLNSRSNLRSVATTDQATSRLTPP